MNLLFLFYISIVTAISLSLASVKVNDKSVHFGEISTQEIKQLPIESTKDKLDIEVYLNDVNAQPHQAIITLGNGKGLDQAFFPKFNINKKALKLSTQVSKIPVSIRNLDKIFIQLVVGDSGAQNLKVSLGELIATEELKQLVPYKKAERVGIKPEIHHIFKQEEKTVNPFWPILFIGFDIVVFLGLLGLWTFGVGGEGLSKSTPPEQKINNFLFFLTLIGFEVIFIRYYLGTSIFTTLLHGFIVSIPCILLGSTCLKHLAYLRSIDRI